MATLNDNVGDKLMYFLHVQDITKPQIWGGNKKQNTFNLMHSPKFCFSSYYTPADTDGERQGCLPGLQNWSQNID